MAGGLEERGRGLEEAFFAQENERLRRELKQGGDEKGLSAVSGISDSGVAKNLGALNVEGDVAAAVALLPLIVVAWADGEIQEKERAALIKAAEQSGIERGSVAHEIFEDLLGRRPSAAALTQWKDYIAVLAVQMDPDARSALRRETVGKARRVAEAAGGFLGIGAVSTQEKAILDELEHAFPV